MFRVVATMTVIIQSTERVVFTRKIIEYDFEKECWHINYLSGGYLTPPSTDFYFVVGGKRGLVKFRDDQW